LLEIRLASSSFIASSLLYRSGLSIRYYFLCDASVLQLVFLVPLGSCVTPDILLSEA
jgi:hypothetical protein